MSHPFPPSPPLSLSLALSDLRLPLPTLTTPSFPTADPFDSLDSHHASLTASHPVASGSHGPSDPSSSTSRAARPLAPLDELSSTVLPGVDISCARQEGQLPPWLEQLSGRVTALAVGGQTAPSGGTAKRTRQRVALGTEGGLVWLLSNGNSSHGSPAPAEDSTPPTPGSVSSARRTSLARRGSHDSLASPTASTPNQQNFPPISGMPPTSPPTSPRPFVPRTRQLSFNGRPKLSHRSSSTSVLSRRVSTPVSPTTAPSITFDLPSHRARKASATVSISTAVGDSPPPATTSAPPPGPTTSADKKTSPKLPSMVVSSPSPSRHRKAKDSITTGIGLWETESVASVSRTSLADDGWAFGSPGSGTPVEERDDILFEEQDEIFSELGPLEVVARVHTSGNGPVVRIEVVDATAWTREEGEALLVLRRSGALSLVSLTDGRIFASCDVGREIAADSQQGSVAFDGFKLVQLGAERLAVCYGHKRAGLVVVDLSTFIAQSPVENKSEGRIDPVVFQRQGVHSFAYAAPSPNDSTQSELLVREIKYEPAVLDEEKTELGTTATRLVKSASIYLDPSHSAGPLQGLTGPVEGLRNVGEELIAWDTQGALLFSLRDGRIAVLAHLQMSDIVDVEVVEGEIVLISTPDEAHFFRLERSAKALNGAFDIRPLATESLVGAERVRKVPSTGSGQGVYSFVVSSAGGGRRKLERVSLDCALGSPTEIAPEVTKVELLHSSAVPDNAEEQEPPRVTSSLKLEDSLILGLSSGAIHHVPLAHLAEGVSTDPSATFLPGAVTVLTTIAVEGRLVLLAGGIDGSAAAWYVDNWDPLGRWSLFASPISHVCPLFSSEQPSATLETCVAFVSLNSPIALVSLHSSKPELLFVLPGTKSGVEKIATRGNEVVVVYREGLARVCDVAGRELRRSMDRRTARGVLKEEGWAVWFDAESSAESAKSVIEPSVEFDLRAELERAASALPWAESAPMSRIPSANGTQAGTPKSLQMERMSSGGSAGASEHLALMRALLGQVVSWGIDPASDDILRDELHVARPAQQLPFALSSGSALTITATDKEGSGPWQVSPHASAQRLLAILTLLRVFLNFPGSERPASQLITFYTSHLAATVGKVFEPPALEVFAGLWLDKQAEVRESARMLFGSYLAVCDPEEVSALVEQQADGLPSRQVIGAPSAGRENLTLLLLGLVGCERFKLLAAPVLRDIALSLAGYLVDSAPFHRQLIAAELCARGFGTWQNYVDAPSLVRQLCGLATGRLPGTPAELRAVGRQAVLHVAGSNAPLFMTTILHDLGKEEAERRNATLKLLGFLIRKKPLVLHTSLPRIAEAVVKSLDPTVTSLRETVHQAATVILNELVRTYPFIGFNHKSQRLAVGTHEGSTILYDLKTATRLYVLEGHSHPVTALTFSPDGRRLVSVSLDEGKCVVWKVGVGVWSLFTPGSAPRQGAAGGEPFKVLDFHVGEEGMMSVAATLEWVAFEWPAERTVRLRIRETALTFSV